MWEKKLVQRCYWNPAVWFAAAVPTKAVRTSAAAPAMGRSVNPNIVERDASGMKFLCVVRLTDRVSVAHYAHHSTPSDQIEHKISQVLLANAATIHPRLSVADKEIGTMHYETDRYAMYLAVTIADYPQRIAFKCLAELKERWADAFGEVLHKAEQGGLSKAAKPVMTELCTKYADAGSIDKTLGLIREVDSVKGIVSETVHRLLNTHENLEVLEDRSEQLKAQTQTFQKVARETKNIQKKKNNKLCRIFCCVILFGIIGAGLPLAITASSPSKTLRLCCVPCYVPCCVPCCSVRGAVLLSPLTWTLPPRSHVFSSSLATGPSRRTGTRSKRSSCPCSRPRSRAAATLVSAVANGTAETGRMGLTGDSATLIYRIIRATGPALSMYETALPMTTGSTFSNGDFRGQAGLRGSGGDPPPTHIHMACTYLLPQSRQSPGRGSSLRVSVCLQESCVRARVEIVLMQGSTQPGYAGNQVLADLPMRLPDCH